MNKEKSLRRELTRLRKAQNPSVIDLRRIKQLRRARTEFWSLRKKTHPSGAIEEGPKKEKAESKRKTEPIEEELTEEEMSKEELTEEEMSKEELTEKESSDEK